jgi:hypothetical protein
MGPTSLLWNHSNMFPVPSRDWTLGPHSCLPQISNPSSTPQGTRLLPCPRLAAFLGWLQVVSGWNVAHHFPHVHYVLSLGHSTPVGHSELGQVEDPAFPTLARRSWHILSSRTWTPSPDVPSSCGGPSLSWQCSGPLQKDADSQARHQGLTPIILVTQEAEIRRIAVQSQLGQIGHKTLS